VDVASLTPRIKEEEKRENSAVNELPFSDFWSEG
jgi:hypothetical protein